MNQIKLLLIFMSVHFCVCAQNFYLKPAADPSQLLSWTVDSLGNSGESPASFTSGTFFIQRSVTVGSPWQVNDLVVAMPSDTQKLILKAPVTVLGVLSLDRGLLVSNDNLTVNLETGYIRQWVSGNIVGKTMVSKAIATAGWHFIGTNLDSVSLKSVLLNNPKIQAFYTYQESVANPDIRKGWEQITDSSFLLVKGAGYAVKFSAPGNLLLKGVYDNYKTGATLQNTYTSSGNPTADGWHLVANPLGCGLDWNYAGTTNIDNAIYYFDQQSGRYSYYVDSVSTGNGSNFVGSLQGFFIHVSQAGGGNITMDAGDLTYINRSLYRVAEQAMPQTLRLKLTSGSQVADETVVRIHPQASYGFDGAYDAYKLSNTPDTITGGVALYTNSGNINYAINSIPMPDTATVRIPLALEGPAGTYQISLGSGLTDPLSVYLYDVLTDSLYAPAEAYSIVRNATDPLFRFQLILDKDGVLTDVAATSLQHTQISTLGNQLLVLNGRNATVSVTNLIGQQILQETIPDNHYSLFLKQGVYVVSVAGENTTVTRKTIISVE